MQGLNFQIDSTYIQSTIPQSDSQTNQENTYSVSFMDMVHNERSLSEFNSAEIKSAEFKPDDSKYRNEDSVYKTDTDVTKSSKKETSVNAEKTSANKDVNNKDYSSSDKTDKMDNYESKIKTAEKTDRDTDDSQEKSVVEKIKNSNQFLAELMHSVKNEKFAAKDSANA
ncbi:hypothetical protein, partial [Treponema sp.]|uniref:hypothetical protein n=1 Tax=Treponema sp. TaxID=166 RepID=UPI00298D9A52